MFLDTLGVLRLMFLLNLDGGDSLQRADRPYFFEFPSSPLNAAKEFQTLNQSLNLSI